MKVIYLIGSLRNPQIPDIGKFLRSLNFEVFDDWHSAGPEADDYWQAYEKHRGHTYPEALQGWHAKDVFAFDKYHLNRSDMAVLVLPAGKSGHLELGYVIGQGKPGFILMDHEPDRFDVMYQFAQGVYFNKEELAKKLCEST